MILTLEDVCDGLQDAGYVNADFDVAGGMFHAVRLPWGDRTLFITDECDVFVLGVYTDAEWEDGEAGIYENHTTVESIVASVHRHCGVNPNE